MIKVPLAFWNCRSSHTLRKEVLCTPHNLYNETIQNKHTIQEQYQTSMIKYKHMILTFLCCIDSIHGSKIKMW